jgi:hypothetical protein
MERFSRTLDHARNGSCSEDTIAYFISQYNHIWEHKALDMTPEAARSVGVNWRAPEAIIDESIFRNPAWSPQSHQISSNFKLLVLSLEYSDWWWDSEADSLSFRRIMSLFRKALGQKS